MITLIAPLEQSVLTEISSFGADEAAGQTTLTIKNSQSFAANDYIILGRLGSETAEVRQISSITDATTIVISAATSFLHKEEEPIVMMLFNKRKFYRSSTQTGTYSHLSSEGSPAVIEVDQPDGTHFEDSTGSTGNWYKATYYNSTTGVETSIDDATATQAGNAESYTSIYKIRSEAGFTGNDFISSEDIGRYRDEAQFEVDGALALRYSVPFSSVPKLVTHITTLLAAGLLLSKEYGVEADVEISKTGERKIQRAEALLKKIVDGDILLVTSSGTTIDSKTTVRVSGSNTYDQSIPDQGELFNLRDENFRFGDPTDPTSSTDRISQDSLVLREWSQRG